MIKLIKRIRERMEWRGISLKDLVGITFAFSVLGALIFISILSMFY
jgi:hypothetical protein